MKALWRRLFGRKDELDDTTTAYIEGRASPAEVDAVRREFDEWRLNAAAKSRNYVRPLL